MSQCARLDIANLDEARFKGEDVRVRQGKRLRLSFPVDLPIRPGPPPVTVDEKGEIRVIEQKLAVQPLNVHGLDVLLARDEIQRRIGLIEE